MIKLPPPEIRVWHDLHELVQMLMFFQHARPRRILEIGCASGGSIWAWAHNCEPGAHIVAASLFEDDAHADPRPLFPLWEQECQVTITPICGDSHAGETLARIANFAPFDWIFIDGDHREAAARSDYAHCLSLAATPGVIALHDVAFPVSEYLAVKPLWEELVKTMPTAQLISKPGNLGIGLVFLRQ